MNLGFSEMMSMQMELWEKHRSKWPPLEPVYARSTLLWMIAEFGEAIDIIKKRGEDAIMNDENTREAFVEEMADVLMYYNDALLKYSISSDEISRAYIRKHKINMQRWS